MEARNSDGSWAGEKAGWTEGDHWAYSLNVMVSQSATKLIEARRSRLDRADGWKCLLRAVYEQAF